MPVSRRLVMVHAHPDDETLATGGALARYAADPGTEVTLVTCTLGEEGEIIPPELAGLAADRADQLGGYRIGELAGACAALGVTDHRFLGGPGTWRDSGMVPVGGGVRAAAPPRLHPRAFAGPAGFAAQVDALVALLAERAPQVVVTYAPDGGYGHPDHVRAHEVTMAAVTRVPAVQKVYAAVVGASGLAAGLAGLDAGALPPAVRRAGADKLVSVPDGEVTTRLDVAAHRVARFAALRAHPTQILVFGSGYALSNLVAQPVLDVESYVLMRGRCGAAPGAVEDDLFAGIDP